MTATQCLRPGLLCAALLSMTVATAQQGQSQQGMSQQDASQQAATPLPTVVVSATRASSDPLLVPAAVDVVSAEDIRRARPLTKLSESLQRIPGVVARDRNNDAQDQQISIRGFGARASFGVRGVRLYSDGIPATMPDGQGQVSHFSLQSADRIEVLRGPFSALYGNAAGGVIALFSAPPPSQPRIELGSVAQSDGLQRHWTWWRGPWRSGEGGYSLDAARIDSDGYRRHATSQRGQAQGLLQGVVGASTRYVVVANNLDLSAQDPQGLSSAELAVDRRAASDGALQFDTRKTARQQQLGVRLEHDTDRDGVFTVTGYTGKRQVAQVLSVPVGAQRNPLSGGGIIDLDRDYHGVDARWRRESQLFDAPFALTIGLQREVSDEHRRGFENFVGAQLGVRGSLRRDEDNRVVGQDWYLQAEWQPAERWRIHAGLRRATVRFSSRDRYISADNPDDSGRLDYARTTPVLGVLYRLAPTLSLYANAGSGFETPSFSELSYRSDGRSGFNEGLRAARSVGYETGLRMRQGGLSLSAAVFDTRTRDELIVVDNSGGRSVYANAGSTRRRGAELSLSGVAASRWHYALAYTLLDARYRGGAVDCVQPPCVSGDDLIVAGNRIPGLARQAAWGELRWQASDDFGVAVEARFVDRVHADDANTAIAPAYATVDLSLERRLRTGVIEWTGFARLDNVLDREVIGSVIINERNGRYFEPAPGRGWALGLSGRLQFD